MSFITLAESKTATKGNIVVTVTKIGDLKAGSSSSRDWTRKDITLQDSSGTESMSVWNDDIKKFVLNHKYELTGIYWKDNNGKSYLNFGQYSSLRDCGIGTEDENQSTMESSTQSEQAPTSDEYLKKKQEEIKQQQDGLVKLDSLSDEQLKFVEDRGIILYKIRKTLEKKIKTVEIDPHPGMIWEMTETIYQDFKEKFLQ